MKVGRQRKERKQDEPEKGLITRMLNSPLGGGAMARGILDYRVVCEGFGLKRVLCVEQINVFVSVNVSICVCMS